MFSKKREESVSQSAPTYIGGNMRIDGKIWGRRPIWIDGEVKGIINCESEVLIGPTAKVQATIRAATIKVNGQVEGELYASERMEVLPQGFIRGNITNLPGCLVIHEGGVIEGGCLTASKVEVKSIMPESRPKLLEAEAAPVKVPQPA